VEIHREDIESLPDLMALMRGAPYRFIVFCDDLLRGRGHQLQVIKAMLEGGIEGRPQRVLRDLEPPPPDGTRHGRQRRSTAINPGEAVEEKVSLSDRFGLWLGFHRCSRTNIGNGRRLHRPLPHPACGREIRREALEWATTCGARSGAWRGSTQDLAGGFGVRLTD
jgi:predicted AAA+ superfamily ATPase